MFAMLSSHQLLLMILLVCFSQLYFFFLFSIIELLLATDWKTVSVHWHQFIPSSSSGPSPREMHSTTVFNNMLVISGGRDSSGEVLSDCWSLHLEELDEGVVQPVWTKQEQLTLPMQTCAHTGITINSSSGEEGQIVSKFVVFGGVTTTGVNDTIISTVINLNDENPHIINIVNQWITLAAASSSSARLGHASCIVTIPGTSDSMILTLGGSDAEKDYNDAWILKL